MVDDPFLTSQQQRPLSLNFLLKPPSKIPIFSQKTEQTPYLTEKSSSSSSDGKPEIRVRYQLHPSKRALDNSDGTI